MTSCLLHFFIQTNKLYTDTSEQNRFTEVTVLRMGIVDFFSGYGAYHHNVVNKWIHIICVPVILTCVNGHGEYFKITAGDSEVNWLLAVNSLAILFYISMNAFSGLVCALWMYGVHFFFMQGMSFYTFQVLTTILDFIATNESAHFLIGTSHALSWIAQFVGHGVFEGRKPALFDNILQGTSKLFFHSLILQFSPRHYS